MKWVWLKCLLPGLLLLVPMYFALHQFGDYAWTVILLTSLIYILYLGVAVPEVKVKQLLYYTAAVFFSFSFYEGFLLIKEGLPANKRTEEFIGSYKDAGYFSPHPYLGYGPSTDGVFTSKKIIKKEIIYDVSYTIKDGLRVTPNSNEISQTCALFFGCSFTIGEGLSDSGTLPFYFNRIANHNYRIINYGFHGYGPHQMLAQIENRVAKDIKEYNGRKIAIYSFLPNCHIARAAGFTDYDRDGPRYELMNGHLTKAGTFRKLSTAVEGKLALSETFRNFFYERKPTHADGIRTAAIIIRCSELLRKEQVNLYVFMWDNPFASGHGFENKKEYDYFMDDMKKNGINILFLHNAIPDYYANKHLYSIRVDGHPNERANEKIANYLFRQITDVGLSPASLPTMYSR